MTETEKADAAPPQPPEINDEELDNAVGGASPQLKPKGIKDGTSNIVDGTSNT